MLMDGTKVASRNEAPPAALWIIVLLVMTPFPILAAAYGYGWPAGLAQPALTMILAWTAVVFSFHGGVRWGLETALIHPRWTRQAISAFSTFAAWGLLLARNRLPDRWLLGGAIAAFLVQWLFDHQAPDVPARYPKLSTALTATACISLAVCLDQAIRG